MKNFLGKRSPRFIRIVFTVVAILALVVVGNNFLRIMVYRVTSNDQCAWRPIPNVPDRYLITDVVPGGVSDRAGIKDGDTLIAIDGKTFKGIGAQALIDRHSAGEYATYLIGRNGHQFTTSVEILKVFDFRYLAQVLLGLGFLLVGYIVVLTKPQGSIQRMFGWYGILSLLFFGLSSASFAPEEQYTIGFLMFGIPFVIARIFALPIFLMFFMSFPIRRRMLDHKWFVPLLYAISTIIATRFVFSGYLEKHLSVLLLNIPYFLGYAFCVAGLVVFTDSYFRLVQRTKRKELRHILIAVSVGIVTLVYLILVMLINPYLIYLQPSYLLPVLLLAFVPFAFGYAIFRYRLMDIDLIVKRSLIYGAVTASLAAVYLLLVLGVGSLIGAIFGQSENKVLSVVALVVIAFIFDPVKRRVQESVDRIFYRERYNYQRALLEFSQELPRQMNLEKILNSMVNRISGTMHVEKVAVVLCDDAEGCYCIARNIPGEYCQFIEGHQGLIDLLKRTGTPQSFALLAEESDSVLLGEIDKEKILRSGVVLAVPMFLQDRLIGTINVGPKLSGKVYSAEDIDLLSTVASQAAIAIENARLHKSEVAKQKIEEELAMARRIQQGLLPKSNPVIDGLDIDGISIPASSVGGDYFDYIRLSPTQLLVVVADVSGKGMSASLYMSKVQGMVQLAARMYTSPRDILVHVNRLLFDGMERKSFITMILALFDLERKEVRICRAGHNKALIRMNGSIANLNSKGIGLGLERGPLFESELEEVRHPLKSGGVFVFYTDGLTEAMNDRGQEFGEDTAMRIVQQQSGKPASEIRQSLIAEIQKFQGAAEQHDDLTLVVVRIKKAHET